MNLLYATKNPAKLDAMRKRLCTLGIELDSLREVAGEIPEVTEDGTTPLENARKKAWAYYHALHRPVFSCDSGLYLEGVKESDQPGVHVRNVGGRCLSDDEMIAHYTGLVKKYGRLKAYYKNAICLVLDESTSFEAMDEDMRSTPFLLADKPHSKIRREGFPLDSISLELTSGKYYYDLDASELDEVAVEDGFLRFFAELRERLDVYQ